MEFTFIIIILVAFFYLNNKINRLEDLIKKGAPSVTPVAPQPPAQPKTPLYTQEAMAAFASPISAAQTQPVQPMPSRPRESSEEVGGRWLGKIGIAAVFFGIAFFLQYAFVNNLIGITGRIILGIIAGIFLLGLGQILRNKYRTYSDILMGGGIGVLYLTIFAASSLYHLIDPGLAFFFIGLVTILSVILSLVDGAVTLAVLGVTGGFFVPLLISTGYNNSFMLFTYLLFLDIGVLCVSFKEHWLKLNYIAFIGTISVFLTWFGSYYSESDLALVFIFVTLYFIVFLISTIAHHIYRKTKSNGADLFLVTINALGYFGISYILLDPSYHEIMGFFALGVAIVYSCVAYLSLSTNPANEPLNYYLPGLTVLFLTIAIPLQLTGSWITLAWLIEAVVLMVLARAINRSIFSVFGVLVYIVGLIRLFTVSASFWYREESFIIFLNSVFFQFVVAIIAAYVIGLTFRKTTDVIMGTKAATLAATFLVIANILTVYALSQEVTKLYEQKIRYAYELRDQQQRDNYNYTGSYDYSYSEGSYENISSLQNQRNTVISIIWALYASFLIAVGFVARSRVFRMFGLIFFFVTAFKVFIDVWSLGELYRIISSIVFGIIALLGSFAYAKYHHRIKEIMYEK